MVTNPNCSTIGLVMALKPIEERFGIEQIFVTTMQAISGAGYPGVPSMDILGNVVPFIGSEEEKMEAETLKLLGKHEGHAVTPLNARIRLWMGTRSASQSSWEPSWAGSRRAKICSWRGRIFVRWLGRDCPPHPINRSTLQSKTTGRSPGSTAIANTAWQRPWAACAPAGCWTGSLSRSRTTRCAAPPAPQF
jgi:hypothetical protein